MEQYWSIVDHEAWDEAVLVCGSSSQEAEDKAEAVILAETAEYRDYDEWPEDADWLETCLSEGWTIRPASKRD